MAEKPKTKYVESKVVRYSNPLNLTSYHLDLFQLRVVMSAIANVSNVDAIDPNKTYFVNATDIMALGTRKQEVYAALRKVSDSLFNGFATIQMRSIQNFPELQAAFKSSYDLFRKDPTKPVFERFHFLTSVTYAEGHGQIGFRFTPAFIPFVQRLKEQFTEFNLMELTGLRSVFAIRIYTMCLQYQNHPDRTFFTTFEELRNLLDLKDAYTRFGNFKQRVLDVAIRQINSSEFTRFSVELELIRGAHNKVTQLKFHLSPKNHVQLARDDDDSKKSRRRKTSVMDSLELDDHQAVLTARQVSYYADLLGGANETYAEKKGYKSHEFFNWLRANKFAPKGHSIEEFVEWLKLHLAEPAFVQKVYVPWLKQLGFKPRKTKVDAAAKRAAQKAAAELAEQMAAEAAAMEPILEPEIVEETPKVKKTAVKKTRTTKAKTTAAAKTAKTAKSTKTTAAKTTKKAATAKTTVKAETKTTKTAKAVKTVKAKTTRIAKKKTEE